MNRFAILIISLVGACVASLPTYALQGRFSANGMDLVLVLEDGRTLRGTDLAELTLTVATERGDADIRLDEVAHEGRIKGVPVTYFRVSIAANRSADAQDFCERDAHGERAAFAYPAGSGFALTCTSGAEAKCILFGYFPWDDRPDIPMRDLHRPCVHMVRADYGGDNHPTARSGTAINVTDRFGIQNPGPAPGMAFEAAWGVDGALCVAHPRIADRITLAQLEERYPQLRRRTGPHRCDADTLRADPRALIFNESNLTWRSKR